jgi:succinoglycan biosynthesis protein ExoM
VHRNRVDGWPATSVDVCICTYRRPQLAETLRSLAAQRGLGAVAMRVVVADNDDAPTARALAIETATALGLELAYLHAPAHNISVARNACLAEARAEWIAFLDDDETAEPLWLSRLLEAAERGAWDAVLGPVKAVYRPQAKAWVRRGDFHSIPRPVWVRGAILTGYTCNALVRREAAGQLRFAEQFGRSGGEDLDFFYRLTDRGGRIGFAPGAVVRDPVLEDRERFQWLTRRYFRAGQSHGVRLLTLTRTPFARAQAVLLASAKAACYALAAVLLLPFGVRRRRQLLGLALHVGVVCKLMGGRLVEIYGQAGAAPAAAAKS